mgnify:CR=1 FL=1
MQGKSIIAGGRGGGGVFSLRDFERLQEWIAYLEINVLVES